MFRKLSLGTCLVALILASPLANLLANPIVTLDQISRYVVHESVMGFQVSAEITNNGEIRENDGNYSFSMDLMLTESFSGIIGEYDVNVNCDNMTVIPQGDGHSYTCMGNFTGEVAISCPTVSNSVNVTQINTQAAISIRTDSVTSGYVSLTTFFARYDVEFSGERFDVGPEDLAGDFNGDCIVDAADVSVLVSNWGPANPDTPGNTNGDDYVDGADAAVLISNWGATCQ